MIGALRVNLQPHEEVVDVGCKWTEVNIKFAIETRESTILGTKSHDSRYSAIMIHQSTGSTLWTGLHYSLRWKENAKLN